jgi:hypothetical protein
VRSDDQEIVKGNWGFGRGSIDPSHLAVRGMRQRAFVILNPYVISHRALNNTTVDADSLTSLAELGLKTVLAFMTANVSCSLITDHTRDKTSGA